EGGKAEGQPLQLGMGSYLKDLEEGIVGMKPGETREVAVKFPEDYFSEALRGAEATFKVALKEIQTLDLPELTDEFAKGLGGGFDTVEKLRARVREDLQKAAEEARRRAVDRAILDKLLEINQVPAPEGMLKKELDHMAEHYAEDLTRQGMDMRGKRIDMEKFRAERGEDAARRIRVSLLLEEIGEQEGLSVGDEDLRARVAEIARGAGQPAERVWASLEKGGHMYEVRRSLLERKVLDFLRAAVKVVEKPKKSDQAD
ncbi:MAG: trigger factor, partial [Candidatus Methylomirabilis sp.]|nr:trigger factor [Deltaproteobacteria bacterium]